MSEADSYGSPVTQSSSIGNRRQSLELGKLGVDQRPHHKAKSRKAKLSMKV